MATNLIYFTGPVRKQTASEEVTMGTEVNTEQNKGKGR